MSLRDIHFGEKKMDKDTAEAALSAAGFNIASENRLPNETGWQLRLCGGQVVSIYDTGKYVVGGKAPDAVKDILAGCDVGPASQNKKTVEPSRKVFVVYGHDGAVRNELEAMLRRWGLEPLILDQIVSAGQTIIEKLELVRQEANFAVVLATPDDEGHRRGHTEESAYRARQNVVLELGMMLAILGRPKVAILLKSDVNMERPSDIQGLIYIPFKETVTEIALVLAKEINAQGIRVDLDKV
jgi:predicted nucleotide-binding protein